ncbi:MAG: CoA transferase [Paracoccaceae bacterium]|nr:CoA transferase [Paracoccaceae bacterium]
MPTEMRIHSPVSARSSAGQVWPRISASKTNALRVENRHALEMALSERTRERSATEILEAREALGDPAGPIHSLDDVFDRSRLRPPRKLFIHPEGMASIRCPVPFSDWIPEPGLTSPRLGKRDSEILDRNEPLSGLDTSTPRLGRQPAGHS